MDKNAIIWLVIFVVGLGIFYFMSGGYAGDKITVVPCSQFDIDGNCVKAFRFTGEGWDETTKSYHQTPTTNFYITSKEDIIVIPAYQDNRDFSTVNTVLISLKAKETYVYQGGLSFYNGTTLFGLIDASCSSEYWHVSNNFEKYWIDGILPENDCFVYLVEFNRTGNVVG